MLIVRRTSAFQNTVFTWKTIPHSPKTIGPDFYVPGIAYLLERKRRRSSTKVVLPANENLSSRTPATAIPVLELSTREQKSSRPPATAVPVLKLCYQRTKSQPAAGNGHWSTIRLFYQRTKIQPAAVDGRSSSKVVLPDNENPAGRRPRPVLKSCYQRTKIQPSKNSAGRRRRPFQYYQTTKIQPAAGDGRSSTRVVPPERENPAGRSTKVVLPEDENLSGSRRSFLLLSTSVFLTRHSAKTWQTITHSPKSNVLTPDQKQNPYLI